MRSDSGRIKNDRGTVPVHAHDNAAYADRLPETRIEVRWIGRGEVQAGCHGLAAQTGLRAAGFSCVMVGRDSVKPACLSFRAKSRNLSFFVWPLFRVIMP